MRPGLQDSLRCLNFARVCYAPKTTLNNFKASAPSKHNVIKRNADVVVDDFAMTFRGVIVTKYGHRSNDLDTRSIRGYENNTLLFIMIFIVRVTFAHHEMDFCSWISCAADPPEKQTSLKKKKKIIYSEQAYFIPLVTINYNLIAFLPDGCANIGGIRGCDFVKNTLRFVGTR